MKKSLIALAVLSAVAGAAQAQSNVTVYGVLDMAINNEHNGAGAAGTKTALDSGVQSGSRLGFKGSEDLGGGLKANFKLEMGVNADAGGSAQGGLAFGRAAWVGLSGDFGALQFGRQNKPMFDAVDNIDPFSTGIIGGTAGSSTSATGLGNLFFSNQTGFEFNPRSNNTANYTTNNLAGFTGSVAYTFGEAVGSTNVNRGIGLSGTYAAGPLVATLAYHTENNATTPIVALRHAFVGATYNFTVVKVAASYGTVTTDEAVKSVDNKVWMVGATVPVSAVGAVIASYTGVTASAVATENKSNQVALGYTHSLSKRTNLYTSFSRIVNDKNVNAGKLASGVGVTERMVNVGIRHMF